LVALFKRDGYAGAVRETVSVAGFMAAARALLSGGVTEDSLGAVGRLLATASSEPGFVQESEMRSLHGGDSSFMLLQTDPDGLTLMLARFSPTEETPVHDHSSWGVACVVKGRDRYRHWEVGDGGRVRVLYEKELGPGSFVTWLDPPRDIHSQQGIGDVALELVLFGKNVTRVARHYYDPKTGDVRTALPE
jgi:predicted metal-dependent enzyme (double-stranded beta helix superfamily)